MRKYRKARVSARTKDLDQIEQDLAKKQENETVELDPDLPGQGQFYCIECAYVRLD
jgi:bud site selection protein 20